MTPNLQQRRDELVRELRRLEVDRSGSGLVDEQIANYRAWLANVERQIAEGGRR